MKREIKFKSYVKLMDGSIKSYIWLPFSCDEQEADMIVHNESVIAYGLQFTGLKDKNGKEIYEGDVLDTTEGLGVVTWTDFDGGYDIIFTDGANVGIWEYATGNRFVIGNIYENPELL